ncbi:SDR family NAD(P)-dependent oxidoreductase [Arthrobacter globiformis]|uniref:SDR family NAD(P)-dependent oxidoreductase n=1 Tax=Arthrobacter globiformis TaxID=1665 RepID=UPI0027D8D257|nr:SDR family oxidoreductase [Arthrobacter globiformis]
MRRQRGSGQGSRRRPRWRGPLAEPLVFDLLDPEASAAAGQIVESRGRLDVLANNAGVNRRGDLLSLTEHDWDLSFAVNVDSLFHLCRAVLPHMIEAGSGAIVNTASQWGLYPAPAHIAYNVSKAAVVAFTKNLARDYAPNNIRVNAVAPGEVHSPMLESGLARNGRTVADLEALVPFGRIGKPEEVAALVAFLASDEAPYICGSVVEITGAQAVA